MIFYTHKDVKAAVETAKNYAEKFLKEVTREVGCVSVELDGEPCFVVADKDAAVLICKMQRMTLESLSLNALLSICEQVHEQDLVEEYDPNKTKAE